MAMAASFVMWHRSYVLNFIPLSHGGAIWNLASIGLLVSKKTKFENVEPEWPWTKVNEWHWPLIFIKLYVLIWLTNFDITDYNSFWKINCFTFFLYKRIIDQIWPCRKIGQGQPRVIIWTNLAVLEYLMLHTKFQGHRPFRSREDFKVFAKYGHGGHFGHVTWTILTNFRCPITWRFHMKFRFNRPSGF